MILNMTGGGGSGATLTIMGVAGATVTASKNGKTYTRTINNSGTAVFKGLSTGIWTVTMSGGGQSTTRAVEITADYSLTIAYFSATITITYPANSTCVVTDSGGATIASDTNTGTAAKTWTATVGATGTYTITATATDGSGKSKSQSVEITSEGQSENVELSYELVLFDGANGGDNIEVTGGWRISGTGSDFSEISSSYLYAANGGGEGIGIWYGSTTTISTKNIIDLSRYSVAEVTVTKTSGTSGFEVGSASLSISTPGTYPLNISTVSSGTVAITASKPAEIWGEYVTKATKIRLH